MNTIRPVKPEIARKLREPLVYREKIMRDKQVSSKMYKFFYLFLFLSMSALLFVLADISSSKRIFDIIINIHFYIFIFFAVVDAITFSLILFAIRFEALEAKIEKLEKMYSEACRGNVYRVHEEMELNGEKYVIPFHYNGDVSGKIGKDLSKAELTLGKKRGFYNFLAKILFSKTKEFYY